MSSEAENFRAGTVVLGGRTNVGKSTLLNRLVGQKVAIVTPRPQTTRRRILGIRTDSDSQIILIDTPGLHTAKTELGNRMLAVAHRSIAEADVVAPVIESGGMLTPADRELLTGLVGEERPIVVVINKIDRISKSACLPLIDEIRQILPNAEIVPVSALKGDNIDELVRTLKSKIKPGPPLMPSDEYTDQTERMLAAEIIREKLFLAMREEVPFGSAVEIERYVEEDERGLIKIAALIIVGRESHKGMVIGAGGRQLKSIGTAARLDLEKILGVRVFLELLVKVERDWMRSERRLTELGL
jgi:GTP-binding protein Era